MVSALVFPHNEKLHDTILYYKIYELSLFTFICLLDDFEIGTAYRSRNRIDLDETVLDEPIKLVIKLADTKFGIARLNHFSCFGISMWLGHVREQSVLNQIILVIFGVQLEFFENVSRNRVFRCDAFS